MCAIDTRQSINAGITLTEISTLWIKWSVLIKTLGSTKCN